MDAPVAQVWQTLISSSGAEALLGPGAAFGGKGEPWHSDEGPSGVLRSYHPQEQLRLVDSLVTTGTIALAFVLSIVVPSVGMFWLLLLVPANLIAGVARRRRGAGSRTVASE